MPKFQCEICKRVYEGRGNNPAPLLSEGVVCSLCNLTKVIPARLRSYREPSEVGR